MSDLHVHELVNVWPPSRILALTQRESCCSHPDSHPHPHPRQVLIWALGMVTMFERMFPEANLHPDLQCTMSNS